MTDEGAKRLSAAVLLRAAEDYKENPDERDDIERWLKSDPICVNIVLPDMTTNDIIRRFKKYAKKDQSKPKPTE